MKKILNSTSLLIAFTTFVSIVSCQKEMAPDFTPEEPSAKEYTLTVDATKGEDTKALSLDGKKLNVKWAGTDQVSVFPESWATPAMGTLTAAASETGSTTLTGTLSPAPTVGDKLNLLFPRAEWNYTGQKGILLSDENSIEKKYDYAAATVTVNEVNAGEITTTASANFTSQQAIVKFRLTDGVSPVAVNSLTISANSGKLVTNKSYRGLEPKTYYSGNGYYTVDAGSGGYNGNEVHNKLVDNDLGTKWCQDKPDGGWYIEFHTSSAIQVDGYMLRTGDDTGKWGQWTRNPQDWVLKAKKNNGDSWTVIDTKSEYSEMPYADNTEKNFDVATPGEYRYFRLEISNNRGNGGTMQLSEMRLFKYADYGQGTSYGNITVTPDAAASELTVALRNENAGADTYTLTATVGSGTYTFSKDGITFENGKYYDIRVPMNAKKVSNISLNKTSASLLIGGTVELSVSNVSPSDAVDKTVTWSSSNSSVASVNASTGVVTAEAAGSATITATANDGSGKTATCSVTVYPAGTIVWDSSNCSSLYIHGGDSSYDNTTIAGINLKCNADHVDASWYSYPGGIEFRANATGGFTFTAPTSKTFTKIEMIAKESSGWDMAAMESKLGSGWVYSGDHMTGIYKVTWTGDASTVNLLTNADHFNGSAITSIAFFVK